MMTKAELLRLRLCYSAACVALDQAADAKRIALDGANRIWNRLAQEVALRAIKAISRARSKQ